MRRPLRVPDCSDEVVPAQLHRAAQTVAAFPAIELYERAASLIFVIDVGQRVQSLVNAAELCQGLPPGGSDDRPPEACA